MQDKFRVFNNGAGQLRGGGAEDQGAAGAASIASDRRARHADAADARRAQDLSPPHRGARLLGSRLRAGDDGAGPRLRDLRRRLRSPAGAVPRSRRRLSRGGAAESPSRFLEHPRDAAGAPSRACEGVSVRRRHRLDGRVHRRPGGALPSLRRLRRSFARQRAATACRGRSSRSSCTRITSRARPTARRAGRGRSAPAAVITKRTRATDRPNRPNLHYCEWIRGWTHTCLEIYGEIAEKNPGFLRQFDDEEVPEKVS